MDVCPVCGSKNLTKIDRMNGYLSYSRVKGDTRLNDAKMAEIAERKSDVRSVRCVTIISPKTTC